jgi:hypothetical protein
MKQRLTIFILLISFTSLSAQTKFSVGDKVEVYNAGWYKAVIKEIGSGSYSGYYKVRYDKYNNDQWMKASNIRTIQSTVNDYSKGPRNGRYIILSYGNINNPITVGYFDLNSGAYTYYNAAKKTLGKGTYSYDGKSKKIQWQSGPFRQANWGGAFEIDRESKTHKIRINTATIGSNSTDSQ